MIQWEKISKQIDTWFASNMIINPMFWIRFLTFKLNTKFRSQLLKLSFSVNKQTNKDHKGTSQEHYMQLHPASHSIWVARQPWHCIANEMEDREYCPLFEGILFDREKILKTEKLQVVICRYCFERKWFELQAKHGEHFTPWHYFEMLLCSKSNNHFSTWSYFRDITCYFLNYQQHQSWHFCYVFVVTCITVLIDLVENAT